MGVLKLSSTNPNFSFVIQKNPQSGLQCRSIRKGVSFGWYNQNGEYCLHFKDSDDELSFEGNNSEFEYLTIGKYTSPVMYVNLLDEYFNSLAKKEHENDVLGYSHTILLGNILIKDERIFETFNKHFLDYQINVVKLFGKIYNVEIKTENKTLLEFYKYVFVFTQFCAITNRDFALGYIDDGYLIKLFKYVADINAPYFIRYWFKMFILIDIKRYKLVEDILHKNTENIKFIYGSLNNNRKDKLFSLLSFQNNVLDFGCNDLRSYGFKLAEKIDENNKFYYAIDIDNDIIETNKIKLKTKDINNVIFLNNINDFIDNFGEELVDVVISEVIEHIPYDDVMKLLQTIKKNIKFNNIYISTPNKDFNIHYQMEEDDIRLDDHCNEMTNVKFKNLINETFGDSYIKEYGYIGDIVDEIGVTQYVLIKRLN